MDSTAMAERDAAREEAIKRMHLLDQRECLGSTTAAAIGLQRWDVKIVRVAGEHLRISGKGSLMIVFLRQALSGLLVSIPSHNRCGLVPLDCKTGDIMNYCDFDNAADAATLAAAIRYLADNGLID